ncbi:MAG: ATP-binding protein [Anaerolineae bacterium]|nr:ATP-binding protein [Anaerolineae bacterium]
MATNNVEPIQSEENVIKTELYLPSILGYEKIARGAVAALAEQIDLPADRIEDLKTAVAEACMNAIEHGNNLTSGINVTVAMLITADKLEVRVADVGVQVIPETLPAPGTSGSMRGWGMFFIKNLVDEMAIKRLPDGGNEVRMIIHITPTEQPQQEPKSITPVDPKPSAIQPAEKKPSAVQAVEKKPSAIAPQEQKSSAVMATKTDDEPKPSSEN